jgi:decaprenylphospho-beta-D-erythro-pentofuranosid-2-ulose 2-reductase
MKNVIILGATSAIVHEVAKSYLSENLLLVAKDSTKLDTFASDLEVRGAKSISKKICDFNSSEHIKALCQHLESLASIDLLIIAHGLLHGNESPLDAAQTMMQVNFFSVVQILTQLEPKLLSEARGVVAVISSVAGDRGRKKNVLYGAAKGGLNIYLAGLRSRWADKGVHVLTIKPGFVDTPMTAGLKKGLLFAKPNSVARDIVRAIDKKRDVLYTPWFWILIMTIICLIPERIIKRTNI